MANMADIIVKKADGTTNVTYTALTPSSGDKTAARWRSNSVSSIPGNRPVCELVTQFNGPKDGRRAYFSLKFPILATVNSVETVVATVPMEFSCLVPQNVDSTQVTEAIAQGTNMIVSALIRQAIIDGYSPT